MRHLFLMSAVLLTVASCAPATLDSGSNPAARQRGKGTQVQCREISRVQCSRDCGPNQDLVTIQCPGETPTLRCEANTSCTAR